MIDSRRYAGSASTPYGGGLRAIGWCGYLGTGGGGATPPPPSLERTPAAGPELAFADATPAAGAVLRDGNVWSSSVAHGGRRGGFAVSSRGIIVAENRVEVVEVGVEDDELDIRGTWSTSTTKGGQGESDTKQGYTVKKTSMPQPTRTTTEPV